MKLPIMQFNTAFPSLTKGLRAAGVKSRFPHISSVYLKEDIGMSICQGHVEMFFTVAPSDVERCDVAIEITMLVFRLRLSTISLVLVEKNN